ncbi:MAG: alpha/beta hydrolase [Phycisphaerae bacterium]
MWSAFAATGCAPLVAPGSGDLSVASSHSPPAPVIERAAAADGARLALQRHAASGEPVLLIHGLAFNASSWDLPARQGPDYSYLSLASLLRDAGYDVWLVNLRGHGNGDDRSRPPPGQMDWTVDHFALYDVPAAVEHVVAATGRRPFVIASSLGAMALAAWLEGATRVGDGASAAPRVAGAPAASASTMIRIVADAALAAERQALLSGAVWVAFPAALRWPESPIDEAGRVVWAELFAGLLAGPDDANVLFESAAYSPGLQGALEVYGSLPLRLLRPSDATEAWKAQLPAPIAALMETISKRLFARGVGAVSIFNGDSPSRLDVVHANRRLVLEDVEAGVLRQIARSIRARAFVSELGSPACVYSDHYANIALPSLVILGDADRNAHAAVARAAFFDMIASTDKSIRVFEGIAHAEFEMSPIATERVYPAILRWLAERAGR